MVMTVVLVVLMPWVVLGMCVGPMIVRCCIVGTMSPSAGVW